MDPLLLNSSAIALISSSTLLFPADFSANNICNLFLNVLGSDDKNLTPLPLKDFAVG